MASSSSKGRRPRSNSLDLPSKKQQQPNNTTSSILQPPTIHPQSHSQTQSPHLNRRLLTDLILTLNQAFADYDFAAATASDFHLLSSSEVAVARINERLSEVATLNSNNNNSNINSTTNNNLLPQLWAAVDHVIQLREAREHVQIYEYVDDSFQRGEEDVLWSFHYLFVNKQLKRILLFTCTETIDNNSMVAETSHNTSSDGLLPVVRDDIYEDYDDNDGALIARKTKFTRRESDSTSHRSGTSRADESESEVVPMETIDDDDDRYDDGNNNDNNSSSSSIGSVDFDLDPADAVSGGIPVDRV